MRSVTGYLDCTPLIHSRLSPGHTRPAACYPNEKTMPFCSITPGRETLPHSITLGRQTDHEGKNSVRQAQYHGAESFTSVAFIKTTDPKIATTDAIAHVIAKMIADGKVRVPTVFLANPLGTIVSLNLCAPGEALESGENCSFSSQAKAITLIQAGLGIAEGLRFALADEDGAINTQLLIKKDGGYQLAAFDFEFANLRTLDDDFESSPQKFLTDFCKDSIEKIPGLPLIAADIPFLPHHGMNGFEKGLAEIKKNGHQAATTYLADYRSTLENFCKLMNKPNLREEILAALQLTQEDLASLPEFDAIIAAFKARASAIQKAIFPDLAPAVKASEATSGLFTGSRRVKRRGSAPAVPVSPLPAPSPPQRERKKPHSRPGSDDVPTVFTFKPYRPN